MAKNFITIQGDFEFQQMLKLMPKQFENNAMRAIARKGGRVVVKRARVRIPGQLGSQIKKDIGVVNDGKNKSGVKVKLRSKYFPGKDGKQRVVSKIARHFTEGVTQTDRKTKRGGKRGRVKTRYPDFIHEAGQSAAPEVMQVMKTESVNIIKKHVAKWQRKLR
jgi:hypothetical protein